MTRTERAAYPRALNRDRSESRTGLDPGIRKGGAGNHNWGSLADEGRLEAGAYDDENMELAQEEMEGDLGDNPSATSPSVGSSKTPEVPSKPPMERSSSASSAATNSLTEEEREKARQLRKNAFKKGDQIDLATIARSSAAVTGSPPKLTNVVRRPGHDNHQVEVP